jgi:polysaccharide biosynthesis transport protein
VTDRAWGTRPIKVPSPLAPREVRAGLEFPSSFFVALSGEWPSSEAWPKGTILNVDKPTNVPMSAAEPSIDVRDYVAVLARRRGLVLALGLGGLVGALLYSASTTPTYSAMAEVLVRPVVVDPASGPEELSLETETEVVLSTAVARMAKDRLGARGTEEDLLEHLSVEVPPDTQVLELTFSAPEPDIARRGAIAFADSYLDFRTTQATDAVLRASEGLQERISQLEGEINTAIVAIAATAPGSPERNSARLQRSLLVSQMTVLRNQLAAVSGVTLDAGQVISRPRLPTSPSSPRYPLNLAVGLLFGLFAGATVAFVADRLDDRLRGRSELERVAGVPVLGVIPEIPTDEDKGSRTASAVAREPNGVLPEAYRRLRGAIQVLSREHPIRTILVTSPSEQEGKTTTAANLALAYAHSGRLVILVSADLRRPRAHELFGLENGAGLSQVLEGSEAAFDVLQDSGVENLEVVASGEVASPPDQLLDPDRVGGMLEELGGSAELVIVDSPPLLAVADALSLAPLVDAVLLVAQDGMTTRMAVAEAREQLDRAGIELIGCVLTRHRPSKGDSHYFEERTQNNGRWLLGRLLNAGGRHRPRPASRSTENSR